MAAILSGGLFTDRLSGEAALSDLKRSGFTTANISEVAGPHLFADQTTAGFEFRDTLTALGMTKTDAAYFAQGVTAGNVLVTVLAGERGAEADAILLRHGADLGSQTLQLHAERLAIEKQRVAAGAARLRKEVITERQSLDVEIFHEELVVERFPVTAAAAVGGAIGATETIVVPLIREDIKVAKQTFVTEEIDIGKRTVVETAHISETVRREELVVEHDVNVNRPHG